MAETLTHIALAKEIVKENPKLFSNNDCKYLIQGGIFPDIHYITDLRTLAYKPNFSKFIHDLDDEEHGYCRWLLDNAKNKQERLFVYGLISHFILDKYIHGYLKNKGIYSDVRHLSAEYYLDTKFPKAQIPIPRFPLKLLKLGLKKYCPKQYDTYKKRIGLSTRALLFHDLVNRFIINKIINARYRKDTYKTRLSLLSLPFKLARLSKYKKLGYDYTILLNPDIKLKKEHTEAMYKEYLKAKKETIDVIVDLELSIPDYTTKQTEIRDFI